MHDLAPDDALVVIAVRDGEELERLARAQLQVKAPDEALVVLSVNAADCRPLIETHVFKYTHQSHTNDTRNPHHELVVVERAVLVDVVLVELPVEPRQDLVVCSRAVRWLLWQGLHMATQHDLGAARHVAGRGAVC